MSPVEKVDLSTTSSAYYAPATVAPPNAQIIHISGQPGSTKGGIIPSDYESQIHLALLNLRKILIVSGSSVKDILKLTLYIVNYDPANRKHTRHVQKFLGGHRPAITLVPVNQLAAPSWLFEVDAVAARPEQATSIQKPLANGVPEDTVDVVIIGAGLAGLSAAHDVLRAGLSCVVLEARDRAGGKTWSVPASENGQGVIDVGAAWINNTNQGKAYALAKRYGADIIEQNTTGLCVLEDESGKVSTFSYGELPGFDVATARDVARIRDMVEADCHTLDPARLQNSEWDSMTFEAYLRSRGASNESLLTATVWTRAMLGQDPRDMSALFFLGYCKAGGGLMQMRSDREGGGQHLRFRQGTQLLANGLASDLPQGLLHLSAPVLDVEQDSSTSTVKVTTADQKVIHGRKVISSVPLRVLSTISFSPKLPDSKQLLAEGSVYGYYTKAMLVFKTPFWVQRGFCGLIQSFTGPASVIRDTSSPPDNKHVLTCFMSGDPGRSWSALSTREREKALVDQIGKLFGAEAQATREFESLTTYEWSKDSYSGGGCPCPVVTPGILDTIGSVSFREPFGNLHFAGTETSTRWKGYMEGALDSGERAAAEVVHGLKGSTSARL